MKQYATKNKDRKAINIAILGVGNCAASLLQGIEYHKINKNSDYEIGGYMISDIEVVCAYDIDCRKVGLKISDAIESGDNCSKQFVKITRKWPVTIEMGIVRDSISKIMANECGKRRIILSDSAEISKDKMIQQLRDNKVNVVVCYLPVGANEAAIEYSKISLDAECAFVNCMPAMVANDNELRNKYNYKNIPLYGDDIMSQIGASKLHGYILWLMKENRCTIERTYQISTGGNSDFYNLLDYERINTKLKSKMMALKNKCNSISEENVFAGPGGYVHWLNDNKICYIRIEGRHFLNSKVTIDVKLDVEDSPNSAACVVDLIRYAKNALDLGDSKCNNDICNKYFKYPSM